MDNLIGKFEAFNVHAGNVGVRWQKWIKRFNNFLTASGITCDERKEALLLHCIGEEIFDLFSSLPEPPQQIDPTTNNPIQISKYDKAILKLNKHFSPQVNIEYEIYNFRQAKQQETETMDEYYARLLKLSTECGFADTDREIKSQIIQGTTCPKLRRYAMRDNPSLQQLITQAKIYEVTEIQIKQMENQNNGESVNRMKTSYKQHPSKNKSYDKDNSKNTNKKCMNCGNNWHMEGRKTCPAININCYHCTKKGHFASVCFKKQNQTTKPSNSNMQETQSSSSSCQTSQSFNKVNFNKQDEDSDCSFNILANNMLKLPKISIYVNNKPLNFIIDTGTSVNLISEMTYLQNFKEVLRPDTSKIFPYCQSQQLDVIGKFSAHLKHQNNSLESEIIVIRGNCESLLSYQASRDLNLVSIKTNFIQNNTDCSKNLEFVQRNFPKLTQGVGNLVNTKIKLHTNPNIEPIANKHRRIPFHLRKLVETELMRLEQQDIIEKVTGPTPWVSPIVVVPKQGNPNLIRICVDMKNPNKAILRERHLTPTIEEVIAQLNGATTFSKIDLKDGYHQLTLHEDSRYITTFSTHIGLFRYKRLSFGINSASEIFQNTISNVLQNITGVINISDDILVYGKTQQEHDAVLQKVLQRLQDNNLTVNTNKCIFNTTKIKFFGYVFSNEGVHPDPSKVNSIINLKSPETVAEVKSFLGMINYVGKFLPNLSENTQLLRELTHKDAKFEWTENHEKAFNTLKQQLSDVTKLAYFDIKKTTHLHVDAGPNGIGAILSQEDKNKNLEIVAYASTTLTAVQRRYSQFEKETLGCTWAIQHFHNYLYGSNFILHCDNLPLVRILENSKSAPNARVERLLLRIQPYNFTIKHQKGLSNPSDYLSRHPLEQNSESNIDKVEEYVNYCIKNAIPKALTLKEVQEATSQDQVFQTIVEALTTKNDKLWKLPELLPYAKLKDEMVCSNEVILRDHRIVLPPSLQNKSIELAHKGHLGITKTKQLLRTKVWFPNLDALTERYIKFCIPCQAVTKQQHRDPIVSSPLPDYPFQCIDVDFAGPFKQNKYIFIVVDEFSRYPIIQIVNSTSFTSLQPTLQNIFATWGFPKSFKSDNGPPFNGSELANFLQNHGTKHIKITPYWPEANGMAERFVKTVKKFLLCCNLENGNFESKIQEFLINYRSTPHSTTEISPFEAVFGRKMNNFLPCIPECRPQESSIHSADHKNKLKQKGFADNKRKTKKHTLQAGDFVLCKQTKKDILTSHYDPKPYEVIQINGTTIKARRENQVLVRNASFFKKIHKQPRENGQKPVQKVMEERQEIEIPIIHLKFSCDPEPVPINYPPTPETNTESEDMHDDMMHNDPIYDIRNLFGESINKDAVEFIFEEEENNRNSNNSSPTSEAYELRPRRTNNVPRRYEDFILD